MLYLSLYWTRCSSTCCPLRRWRIQRATSWRRCAAVIALLRSHFLPCSVSLHVSFYFRCLLFCSVLIGYALSLQGLAVYLVVVKFLCARLTLFSTLIIHYFLNGQDLLHEMFARVHQPISQFINSILTGRDPGGESCRSLVFSSVLAYDFTISNLGCFVIVKKKAYFHQFPLADEDTWMT